MLKDYVPDPSEKLPGWKLKKVRERWRWTIRNGGIFDYRFHDFEGFFHEGVGNFSTTVERPGRKDLALVKWCGCVENWIPARSWKIKFAVLFYRQEAAGEFNKRVSSHILFSDFILRPAFDVLKSCFNLWTFWQTPNELFSLKPGSVRKCRKILYRRAPGFKGEILLLSATQR